MARQHSWLIEITEVLNELDGQATLTDIYRRVKDRGIMNIGSYSDWTVPIRKTIYRHSSDADIFKGRIGDENDIFYSITGKGKGIWGLRDFEPTGAETELTEDDTSFPEGKKELRQHVYRERNPKVIRLAKERFKKENNNRLFCEVCSFDFYETYGKVGEDFIEGHHTIPVSELEEGQKTRVEDIALVCSNCHRMLHRKRPWLTKEQLRNLVTNI